MAANAPEGVAARPCHTADLVALIGLLAVIEGELMAGGVPDDLAGRLHHRFATARLLEAGGTERDLRQSINDLNHRLRYALGEYDQPPSTVPVPD